MASFAAMIFRDPAFTPHLPRLVKLVVFSAAVHMACFGTLSRLKFAVGAVQDAGLIFLSAISSSVVAFSQEQGVDEAGMLSTSGDQQHWRLWRPGQPRGAPASAARGLAGLVMYLSLRRFPSPTTLPLLMAAFLGTFFAFLWVTGTTLDEARAAGWVSPASPMLPLNHAWDYFSFADIHWGAFVRYHQKRRERTLQRHNIEVHAIRLGLQRALLLCPVRTVDEGIYHECGYPQEHGCSWLRVRTQTGKTWSRRLCIYGRYPPRAGIPPLVPNLLAMIVVVAFSSCLDVAAIEMEMAKRLDFNGELQTVGWSNVISGLFGGFTGSYIFSQTIFNLRAGVG
ncbi:conserved unknown protein [Ectocarpus siliculosus]|uniref:SLC26A/SulP transporter domain-containing protein n=1 Tax=Ectocarpus siliculosus TaxID=2880 RepID=D7FMX0_ECTSI|nr:conserved unknown protein [Ectocarpus siliculosus]|eukprot:CBJ30034.1 conserved unknown protein [Ectocarpus siliculosus]